MTQIKLKCKFCNSEFCTPLKRYNYLKKKNKHKSFYCNKLCFINDTISKPIKRICLYCKKEFDSTTASNARKFCSSFCSSKYSNSFVKADNVSNSMIQWWKKRSFNYKIRKCRCCDVDMPPKTYRGCCSKLCSKKMISLGGRNSANLQSQSRRSKNEKRFFDLCCKKFQNVTSNEPIFNGWDADVILNNEKVAVLWNGKWHYEKITKKHSVKQVQNRDSIKTKEIINFGYMPYVIKDLGKENIDFVNQEFKKFNSFLLTYNKDGV